MAIRIDKLHSGAKRITTKAAKETQLVQTLSRELQMVPKYLECAKAKAGDLYRFNTKQVNEITSACKKYKTNLSVTDVVKDLLEIGSKEGNCKQLTSEEMIGFFNATSGMKNHEQMNVLRFLKAAQEDIPAKITPDYLRTKHPYEWFRNLSIRMEKANPKAYNPDYIKEEFIKTRYENFIAKEFQDLTNPHYSTYLNPQKFPLVKYITDNNTDVVSEIASCNNPTALFNIWKLKGVSPHILEASGDLVTLYEMSKGNMFLIKDVSRAYFLNEIEEITKVLKSEFPQNRKTLETYYDVALVEKSGLRWIRPKILEILGIKDKIKLVKLEYEKVEDVYPENIAGNIRGHRILGGSFERGKKK